MTEQPAIAGADDLLALARSADSTLTAPIAGTKEAEDQAAAAAAAAAQQPQLTLEQELAGMFAMIGSGLGYWLPSVKSVLNDQACADVGKVLAPVAVKWNIARFFQGFAWRLELQALMVVAPLGAAVVGAVKHDLAELERRQLEASGQAPPASPAPSSSPPAGSPATGPMLVPIQRPQP